MKKSVFAISVLLAAKLFAQPAILPVVFHVVYMTSAQNIPDSCMQHQLDVLNEDLNANNADIWKVPAVWQPIIGNMNIQFVFASLDPNGNPTTGIERVQTATPSFITNDNVKHVATGGLDAWPDTSYLNIWVCNLQGGLTGYTQFPGGPDATDGIVLNYLVVGRGNYLNAPFDHGRTATHEFGHWLGLRHIGPDPSCTDIDSCADTPSFMSNTVYGTYPVGTVLTDGCQPSAPGIMWMNFMMYVDDTAMVFFTQDQIGKMTWYLNNMRQGLLTPTGIREDQRPSAYTVFPSPSQDGFFTLTRSDASSNATVEVYDIEGRMLQQPLLFAAGAGTMHLDLSSYAEGVYSIILRSESGIESRQVVISY